MWSLMLVLLHPVWNLEYRGGGHSYSMKPTATLSLQLLLGPRFVIQRVGGTQALNKKLQGGLRAALNA